MVHVCVTGDCWCKFLDINLDGDSHKQQLRAVCVNYADAEAARIAKTDANHVIWPRISKYSLCAYYTTFEVINYIKLLDS